MKIARRPAPEHHTGQERAQDDVEAEVARHQEQREQQRQGEPLRVIVANRSLHARRGTKVSSRATAPIATSETRPRTLPLVHRKIAGDAGIGKATLVQALVARAPWEG